MQKIKYIEDIAYNTMHKIEYNKHKSLHIVEYIENISKKTMNIYSPIYYGLVGLIH
jgi:hypothetical protein